ncbi:hypothetical protein Taro_022846 [Colocasia esculenta]|uniref:Uncharacterized protein n=1 Tax=Colocasia esculenta TaxID=4460 RepID=A0A843V306_COLES|nr:hypothetical protein [Colocasia esculenta]
MRSHRQPATTLPERNLGAVPEISECDLVPTGTKCRFRIGASRAVSIAGRTNIRVLPKNFGPETEFHKTSTLSTVSEC